MVSRLPLAVAVACALMFQSVSAQPSAQIKKTNTPPVIDGNVTDAAWANANVYNTETFNFVGTMTPVPADDDITLEWRALWDNNNLYVMAKAKDDVIVNLLPDTGGVDDGQEHWNDDSIEFYIDAQDRNNTEFNPPTGLEEPTYQLTAVAGWTPTIANDPNYLYPDDHPTLAGQPVSPRINRTPNSLPNTSFTWGINSYAGNDDATRYPQTMGSATSSPVTANPAGGFDWSFEASFPWEALEETPADILARDGIFGFGVAYNDDDDRLGRDAQYMWASSFTDGWHRSDQFPDVQLVDAPAPLQGDYNNNGTVDAADYVRWRDNPGAFGGDPGFTTWRTNFGKSAGAAAGLGAAAAATPEPATLVMLMLLTAAGLLRRKRG
jgi:hypothetical protein